MLNSLTWARAAVTLSAVFFVAACAPAASPSPAPAAGRSAAAPAAPAATNEPKFGGILVMAQRDAPETLNYPVSGTRAAAIAFDHFNESLVQYDQSVDFRVDYPINPALAESWQQVDDKTWTFKIRSGVKWHDGTPLTAEAVAWSMEYIRDKSNGYPSSSNLSQVEKVTAEPGNVVKFTTTVAVPLFLQTGGQTVVIPKHIFDAGGKDALASKMVGTSPFALEKFDRVSRTTFKRFPEYWNKDKAGRQLPYLDGFQVIHNMDQSAQNAAMAARQVDIQLFADKVSYDAFKKQVPDIKLDKFQYASDPSIMFNTKRPWIEKLEVRKALNLIIDRQELKDNYASGEGLLALPGIGAMKTGYSFPQEELEKLPGYRKDKTADLAEARRLLDAAGVPKDHEFRYLNYSTLTSAPLGEIALNQFRRFGLKIKYETLDDATITREFRAGNYDFGLRILASAEPVTGSYNNYNSKSAGNYMFLADAEIDRITNEMRATGDKEVIKKLSRQFHERMLDQVYTMGLIAAPLYMTTQPWVFDYWHTRAIQPSMAVAAATVWIDKDLLPANRK